MKRVKLVLLFSLFVTIIILLCSCTSISQSKSFLVTFDTQGGSAVSSCSVKEGDTFVFPNNPEKEGYEFAGWYLDKELLHGFDNTDYIDCDITLYAKWVEKAYDLKISIDAENGGEVVGSGSHLYKETMMLNASPNPGFVFDGWYQNGLLLSNSKQYEYEMPAHNVVITAKFFYNLNIVNNIVQGVYKNDVEEIIVPDNVDGIKKGAFQNCRNLKSIVVPFIGSSLEPPEGSSENFFGYIFGADNYSKQNSFIPTTLMKVAISNKKDIVNIPNHAFYDCISLNEFSICDNTIINSIGRLAFAGCKNINKVFVFDLSMWSEIYFASQTSSPLYYSNELYVDEAVVEDLVIPETTININRYAFCGLKNIKSIYIPASVDYIDKDAFDKSKESLDKIEVSANNSTYYSEGNCLIDKRQQILMIGTNNSIIPSDGIVSISDYAFYNCNRLSNISINKSISYIGNYAFANCGIEELYVPSNVLVKNIKKCAFASNKKLTTINWDTTEGGNFSEWEDRNKYPIFSNCNAVKNIIIGEHATSIPSFVFSGCKNLNEITIPSTVTHMTVNTFVGCPKLVHITNLSKIKFSTTKEIGAALNGEVRTNLATAFKGVLSVDNNYIQTYTLNGQRYFLGYHGTSTRLDLSNYKVDDIFVDCSIGEKVELEEFVLPIIKKIPASSFYNNTNLKSIIIPNGITQIGNSAFYECTNLSNVIMSNTIKYIDNWAFASCDSLLNIKIPNSVIKIGAYAFAYCRNLSNIDIPKELFFIDMGAFHDTLWYNSQQENEVIYIGNVAYGYKYTSIPNNTSLVIKEGTIGIAGFAFYQQKNITNITIPNSVKYVGNAAFHDTAWYEKQPDGMIYIGKNAYDYKGSMPENTTIYIKEGTISISDSALSRNNLRSLVIPQSILFLGDDIVTTSSYGSLKDIKYKGTKTQWYNIGNSENAVTGSCSIICTDGIIEL